MGKGLALSVAMARCPEYPPPTLDLFYRETQRIMEGPHTPEEAWHSLDELAPNEAITKLKFMHGLNRWVAQATHCYHLPAPTVECVNRLVATAPADPVRLVWPRSHGWIQFDEPFPIGAPDEFISALHFVKRSDPAMIPLLKEARQGMPELGHDLDLLYAGEVGRWELEPIPWSPVIEGIPPLLKNGTLFYDATCLRWSYSARAHSCAACSKELCTKHDCILIECAGCREKRTARSTWFATALALLQGRYPEAGDIQISEITFDTPSHLRGHPYGIRRKALTVAAVTPPSDTHPPSAHEGGQPGAEEALGLLPFTGIFQHPETKRHQVWVSSDLDRLQWAVAHRFEAGAERLSAMINARKEELRHPVHLQNFLRLLALEGERAPAPVSAEVERTLLTSARIAAQRPRFERSLDDFSAFLHTVQQMGVAHPSQQPFLSPLAAQALPWFEQLQAAYFARRTQEMSLFFVEDSALKMCEAMLAIDGSAPEFPGQPLWIQPLAPLWFRGLLVRGVGVTPLSLRPLYDRDAVKREVATDEQETDWQRIAHYEGGWHVYLVVDPNYRQQQVPPKSSRAEALLPISFAWFSSMGTWELTLRAAETCPVGRCLHEVVGAESTVVPCERCEEDLATWTRWVKTMFWVLSGKFRKADDATPFEITTLTLTAELESPSAQGDAQPDQPRRYEVQLVAFDASYFKNAAPPQHERRALADMYIVLTDQEALAKGIVEVDMDGVLIRDFGPVRGYYRRKPRCEEKEYIGPKDRRAQYVSLRTWKARQQGQEHRASDVSASDYLLQLTVPGGADAR
jgi:hypothetical protein